MKLNLIITTGLLSLSMLSFSGCDLLDDLTDPESYVGSMNVVNQDSAGLDVTVDGETKFVESQSVAGVFTPVSTNDTYRVTTQVTPDLTFEKGEIFVLGISSSNCTNGYLIDRADEKKIHIMNLSNKTINATNVKITFTPAGKTLPEDVVFTDVSTCQVESTFAGSTIGTWTLQIGNATERSVEIKKDIALDFVVYDYTNEKGMIVPLVSLSDLQ